MKRILLSLFAAAALLFGGLAPAQVATDAGKTGIARVAHLLCASGVASSVTGTTTETALATCTIPAGAMGLNGGLQILSAWSMTSSANSKTPRIRFGGTVGTQYMAVVLTTSALLGDSRRIRNRGSVASQIGGFNSVSVVGFGSNANALVTSSLNTSIDQDIVLSCQLGLGSESCVLENYEVWLLP